MRRFDFYFFEQFDAELAAADPANPRRLPGPATDAALTAVAQGESVAPEEVRRLAEAGVLRREGGALRFDSPVFLREDAAALHSLAAPVAARMVDRLAGRMGEIRSVCGAGERLYFLLCGMVLDGTLFDALQARGAVATSRMHASGLDYLCVIYERCEALDALSRGLLCSWNRWIGESCALQSFGDADGDRLDFYRVARLMEQGRATGRYAGAARAMTLLGDDRREAITRGAAALCRGGDCPPAVLAALELMGYARQGRICVPVLRRKDEEAVARIGAVVEDCLADALAQELSALARDPSLTAVRHGVAPGEIANELYHLVFGFINEELAARGLVASPGRIPGEGRYLRSISLA